MKSKNYLFSAILLAIGLVLAELGAFALVWLYRDFYSHEERFLKRLDGRESDYQRFLATAYDAEAGWRNSISEKRETKDCRGEPITYNTDKNAARINGPNLQPPEAVQIVAVGDSYTYGIDEANQASYPAVLEQLTGVAVANQGVGAYGPLQAVLRFEQVAPFYPNAKVAVLGIMHENIRRMPNSYRSVLFEKSGTYFAFKPYVEIRNGGPKFAANPNSPAPADFEGLSALAERAFEDDYWAKPSARFPYLLNLLRSLGSDYTVKKKIGGTGRSLGFDEFAMEYRDEKLRAALELVITRFVETAKSYEMAPVVAFIPHADRDRNTPDEFISALEAKPQFADTAFVRVGHSTAGWSAYRPDLNCHPTAQGYRIIADEVHAAIKHHGLLKP